MNSPAGPFSRSEQLFSFDRSERATRACRRDQKWATLIGTERDRDCAGDSTRSQALGLGPVARRFRSDGHFCSIETARLRTELFEYRSSAQVPLILFSLSGAQRST